MIPKVYINKILDLLSITQKPIWCRLIGNSMAPLLCNGDSLLVQRGNRKIRIGDVIIFNSSKHQCAHRVVGITLAHGQKRFVVKGDNSCHFDQPVHPERVLGKVICVKGSQGTLYLDSVLWRYINFFVAKYSYVEARRHESNNLFWRIINQIFIRCHNLKWCNKIHRHDLYKCLIFINK
jgi:signal peptidase I